MFRLTSFGRRVSVAVMSVVLMASVPGCNKVDQDHFAKLQTNMSEAEVENVLGSPTSTETVNSVLGNASEKVWKNGDKSITVHFISGKVMDVEKKGF